MVGSSLKWYSYFGLIPFGADSPSYVKHVGFVEKVSTASESFGLTHNSPMGLSFRRFGRDLDVLRRSTLAQGSQVNSSSKTLQNDSGGNRKDCDDSCDRTGVPRTVGRGFSFWRLVVGLDSNPPRVGCFHRHWHRPDAAATGGWGLAGR